MKPLCCVALAMIAAMAGASEPVVYTGMADASGAVWVGDGRFAVANDEDNVLRVYTKAGGEAIAKLSLDAHLGVAKEADIEGAAPLGDRVYWITSHGRNRDGEAQGRRLRFLATDAKATQPEGIAHKGLVKAMLAHPRAAELGLVAAIGEGVKEDKALAPKDGGLNIEGLAAAPDGKGLLIAFRNPIPMARALILPLKNHADLVSQEQATAALGEPILLDLGGLGIRSLEWDAARGHYWIVAGRHDEERQFALYSWKGPGTAEVTRSAALDDIPPDFSPEALLVSEVGALLLLSDDGSLEKTSKESGEKMENKDLPEAERTFRSITITDP